MIEKLLGVDENVVAAGIVVAGAIVAYFLFFKEDSIETERTRKSPAKLFKPAVRKLSKTESVRQESAGDEALAARGGKADFVILFGSQTGTAEDFAHAIRTTAKKIGMRARVIDLEDYDAEQQLAHESLCIFLMATYGEGEPTDNAKQFYEYVMSNARTADQDDGRPLQSLSYAVFGLGNKTYEQYNAIGKAVDTRLEELGAQRLLPVGLGDDDRSIEDDFSSWKRKLWPVLAKACGVNSNSLGEASKSVEHDVREARYRLVRHSAATATGAAVAAASRVGSSEAKYFDLKTPYSQARIVVNRELHSNASDRSCRHLELEVDNRLPYVTGDHVGVYPENDPQLVSALCKRLGEDPETIIELVPLASGGEGADDNVHGSLLGPCSLATALARFTDFLAVPRQHVLATLAQFASDADERRRLELLGSTNEEGSKAYHEHLHAPLRSLVEILQEFHSLTPPLGLLLELLPRLAPRYYSISSSPTSFPRTIHITAVVTEFKTPSGRLHTGICTGWYRRLAMDAVPTPSVSCFVRHSNFKLPPDPSTPLIMIGPGTGVAPFRGFLQERAAVKAAGGELGESILFFGCRRRDEDYIYGDELEAYVRDGVLSDLQVAFSREHSAKCYVQHLLLKPSMMDKLWRLISNERAYVYVCGDARAMAKDVNNALIEIARAKLDGATVDIAEKYVSRLSKQHRYLKDTWQ